MPLLLGKVFTVHIETTDLAYFNEMPRDVQIRRCAVSMFFPQNKCNGCQRAHANLDYDHIMLTLASLMVALAAILQNMAH